MVRWRYGYLRVDQCDGLRVHCAGGVAPPAADDDAEQRNRRDRADDDPDSGCGGEPRRLAATIIGGVQVIGTSDVEVVVSQVDGLPRQSNGDA